MPAPGVAPPGLGCHGAKRRPGARAPGSTISPLRGSREMPPPERKRARRGAARTEKTDQSGRSDQDQPFVSLAVPAVSGVGARVQTTSVIGHTRLGKNLGAIAVQIPMPTAMKAIVVYCVILLNSARLGFRPAVVFRTGARRGSSSRMADSRSGRAEEGVAELHDQAAMSWNLTAASRSAADWCRSCSG